MERFKKTKEFFNKNKSNSELDNLIKNYHDQLPGGRADTNKPLEFNKDQLKRGMEIESEHTNDKMKALEIAMDHLTENPKYYDALEKMEKSFHE